jgi:uncharacterized protein
MRKRRIFWAGSAVLLGYLSLSALGGAIVGEATLHPARRPIPATEQEQAQAWARDDDASFSDVSISAQDGAVLRAWFLRPEEWNGNGVVLLHGMGDNRLGMSAYADMLVIHGYSVLMPDARAHGSSGGAFATYGLLEEDDIHRWVGWLITNQHSHCVDGFGESMGAAQLLQSLRTEPRFCAVAAECPFSTFREVAYDRMGQRFKAGPWVGRTLLRPLVESAFLYVKWRHGLDLARVSPENVVATTKVPVLLIHGQDDTNIPIRHSRRIAARNSQVVLWEVPHAGHSNAIDAAPQELQKRLIDWFDAHSAQ